MLPQDLFATRPIVAAKQINFMIGVKAGEDGKKAYLIELDPSYECRVGELLEGIDARTNKRYLFIVADIEPAYAHREEHADMLDLLRRRPDKTIDDVTFRALCKNMAMCTLLGEIAHDQVVEHGYRPNKYTTTASVANNTLEEILVTDWQEGVVLGSLRLGHGSRPELAIHFPTTQLVGARFLIVGQTGKGKSTAMRQLLDGHMRLMQTNQQARRVGFLVDDFKMEYPFDTVNQHTQRVPGLMNKLGGIATQQLVVLTTHPERYVRHQQKLRAILPLQIPIDSLSLSVFADLADLTGPQRNVVTLVEESGRTSATGFFNDLFAQDAFGMPDVLSWGKKYGPIFFSKAGRAKARAHKEIEGEEDIDTNLSERLSYVRRAAQRLLKAPFMTRTAQNGNCLPQLLQYLSEGCTVIIDKSHLEDHQRELLSVMLLYHLFRHNQQLASGSDQERTRMIPVVVAVEEAQYLLSKEKVADPDSIFAKIAFTGRSYQIGLLAITQRPQAIQKELLGQFDGFLVLPMEHLNDFKHLADACPALAGFREDLASAPIGGGIVAFGTPKKVVAVAITNYVDDAGAVAHA